MFSLFRRTPPAPARTRPARPRLSVESLEDRTVLSPVIGGLDSSRQGAYSLTGGDVSVPGSYDASQDRMSTLRGAVRASFPGATLSAAPALTADYLSTVNVVVTGSAGWGDYDATTGWPATTLSADEQAALLHFVENGGGAVIMVDNDDFRGYFSTTDPANQSFVRPFGVHDTGHLRAVSGFPWDSGLVPAVPTDPTSPVVAGPFGTVSRIMTGDPGYFDDLGPYAAGLATFSTYGTVAAAVIPRGALSPTSGPVVFASDVTAFDDDRMGYAGYDNLTFALNALAYVAPVNRDPTADPGGPYTITSGSGLTFDASHSSDPDGDPLTYSWAVNGHAGAAAGPTPTLTWADLRALGVAGTGSYALSVTVDDGHGHAVTSDPVALTVNPAVLTVTAPGVTKTYGDAITVGGTVSGVVPGDAITFSFASDGAAAGAGVAGSPYPITATLSDPDGRIGNYVVSFDLGAVTVTKATPAVTAVGGSFVYDGQPHPATGSVTGVSGASLGAPTFTYYYQDGDGNWVPTGDNGADLPADAGNYLAVGSFAGDDDYLPASAEVSVTIAYDARTLTDLSQAFRAGRTIPIKIQLTDANGNNVSSSDITLTAVHLWRLNADGTRTEVTLADAGGSNPGDLFRYDAALGGYVFNLSTKGLTAGTYAFDWVVDGDPTTHELKLKLA